MQPEWFAPLVEGWTESAPVRQKLMDLLLRIAETAQLELIDDEDQPASDDERRSFTASAVVRLLEKRLSTFAETVRPEPLRLFLERGMRSPSFALDAVAPARWRPVVSVNSASLDELEELPVLGPELARRIVETRERQGPFSDVEDLDRIPGIGGKSLERLDEMLTLELPRPMAPHSPALDAFVAEPTVDHWVAFVRATPLCFTRALESAGSDEVFLAELESLAAEARIVRELRFAPRRRTVSATAREAAWMDDAKTQRADAVTDARGAALIVDREYLPFVRSMIDSATQRIHMVMFFMSFHERRQQALNDLVDSLGDAHRRGVEVRVLLDTDLEGDAAKSRIVNRSAYRRLQQHGVSVRLDSEERGVHSKIVLVDDSLVLLGSHNWTLGSLLRYDDVSVYLESPALAARYKARFDKVWDEDSRAPRMEIPT